MWYQGVIQLVIDTLSLIIWGFEGVSIKGQKIKTFLQKTENWTKKLKKFLQKIKNGTKKLKKFLKKSKIGPKN